MILADAPDAYGYTIFCDDVRQEVGGKVSFIGVYGDQMLVHADFPVTIPRIGLGITLMQKKTAFKTPTKLLIFLPGDAEDVPSVVVEGPPEESTKAAQQSAVTNNHAMIRTSTAMVLGPLQFSQPGHILVRMEVDGKLVRCGALDVSRAPQTTEEIL